MSFPTPEINELNRPYWEGLATGELRFQHCETCGHNWLPPRAACPACLGRAIVWRASAGRGRVVSWVVYHRAYADHLAAKLPYDVTIVALDEGPRLLTNVIDSDAGQRLRVGGGVVLAIEAENGVNLARFRLDAEESAT
jgi:uncharacterized OB-fold protein